MRQLIKAVGAIAALGVIAVGISTVAAHHSTTMFDHSKTMTIKGTVVELRWVNPHVTLSVNGIVKEGEAPAEWLMEMTSPGNLVRAGGWSRNAVKAGEKVGGASCGECHTVGGDKNPPSVASRAYNFRFSHDAHVGRAQCTECHSVLGGDSSAQVSLPQLKEHRGAGFTKSCGSCHNGSRAFSGEQGKGCSCNRCHVQQDILHRCM
jgi:c(7)-type cytochrome triheme protein